MPRPHFEFQRHLVFEQTGSHVPLQRWRAKVSSSISRMFRKTTSPALGTAKRITSHDFDEDIDPGVLAFLRFEFYLIEFPAFADCPGTVPMR